MTKPKLNEVTEIISLPEMAEVEPQAEDVREYPVVMRSIWDIELHPLVACLPMFGPDAPEMKELRLRFDKFGFKEACLCIDEDGLLFDGRHTLMIARETTCEEIACRVYPREEVPQRIRALGMGRVHLSKSAKAYWWWPFYKARAVQHGGWRGNQHTGNLAKYDNHTLPESEEEPLTMDRIAEELGVGRQLVFAAKEVHEFFEIYPEARAEWEPKVLSGELPLNRVRCAYEGKKPYVEEDPMVAARLEGRRNYFKFAAVSFGRASDHLIKGWDKMDVAHKGKLAEFLGQAMTRWPEDLRESVLRHYRKTLNGQKMS